VLRVAFGHVKTLGIRNKLISKLYQHFRVRVTPTAYRMLCLRFACFVRPSLDSATDARLDTGGWLTLSRGGLSPPKTRRASPGARTDGAYGPGLNTAGFKTYVTFPKKDVLAYKDPESLEDYKLLSQIIKERKNDSYEMFAYDAMLLLAVAADTCKHTDRAIGRTCLMDALHGMRGAKGAAELYSFEGGENRRASYFVYQARSDDLYADARFEHVWEVGTEQIDSILHEHQGG
jgi:hypothetical protein